MFKWIIIILHISYRIFNQYYTFESNIQLITIIDVFHAVYIFFVNVILTSAVPKYFRSSSSSSSSKLLQNVYKIISTLHLLSPFCHRSAPSLSATNCTLFEHGPHNIP